MSECSLTVHGMTLSPSAFASASDAAVTSRWLGDHTEQPAAATSRGTEPAKSSMSSPAVHGDAPGRPRCRVSPLPPIDAQADALDLRCDAARDHKRAPIEGLN